MSKTTGSDALIDQIFQEHFASVGPEVRHTQRRIIRSIFERQNTLGLMPTGSGKSLCYWIAGKGLGGVTLVIFPLTALMDEQALKLREHGCKVCVLHSGIDTREQFKELTALNNQTGKPDFIFLSPERLATDGFLEFVLRRIRDQIHLVVIDEAHCISQWGLDFRPFYKEIPPFLDALFENHPWPPVLCLTATINPKDREQICQDFRIKPQQVIEHDILLRPEIHVQVVKVPNEDTKDQQFWELLEVHRGEKVLVYIDRKHKKRSVEELNAIALKRGFQSTYFHGEMKSEEKAEVVRRFKAGELRIVFATSAFGMGIDIPDIRGVIHYQLPESVEQYYQQIGRAGRDGNPAWAVLFYSDKNIEVRQSWFIDKSFPTEEDIRHAFLILTDGTTGRHTVNYFDESDGTQSGYHYLIRSQSIRLVCKGIQSLAVFKPARNVVLPEFEAYRSLSKPGLLITTARRAQQSEAAICEKLYTWMAEGKLQMESAPGRCLVVESLSETLPDELLASILADIKEKREYRTRIFLEFMALLNQYADTFQFHQQVGQYLGIDKFRYQRAHRTLAGDLVRSKSEVIIANILFDRHIPYEYEKMLSAPDGSCYLPDFTITWNGVEYYWEHLGLLGDEGYERHWMRKEAWYHSHFPGRLITTQESATLSRETELLIARHFA